MNEPRDHMTILQVVVVVRSVDVGWYDTSEHTPILLMICPVENGNGNFVCGSIPYRNRAYLFCMSMSLLAYA